MQKKFDEVIIKTTIEFNDKIDILFSQLFLNTKHTDLNDTLKYNYFKIFIGEGVHESVLQPPVKRAIVKVRITNGG